MEFTEWTKEARRIAARREIRAKIGCFVKSSILVAAGSAICAAFVWVGVALDIIAGV